MYTVIKWFLTLSAGLALGMLTSAYHGPIAGGFGFAAAAGVVACSLKEPKEG